MNKIIILFFVLTCSNNLFSQVTQYSSGNSAIAPLPLYSPDYNQMSRSLDRANANYEYQLNQMRERYNAMSPEEKQAYIAQLKAQEEAQERSSKIGRKIQTIGYAVIATVALISFLIRK